VSLLARYVLRELLVPLGTWVVFLFFLLLVMQFLRGTEVLLGSAVTGGDLGWLILYLTPHFLVLALPIAFLLALLLGLGRLGEDRELTALHALGVGPLRLVVVPLAVGLVLGALMLFLSFTAQPWGLTSVRLMVNEVIKNNVVGDVKPGVFYDDLSQLTLYAERVSPEDGRWQNVLLHDDNDPGAPLLVLAREGRVLPSGVGEAVQLQLSNGEVHRASRASTDYALVTFGRAEIVVGVSESIQRKNRFRSVKEELTPAELLEQAREARQEGGDPRPFLMHFHSRLGLAAAPVAFAMLGTPLALSRRRGGRAWGFLFTLGGYVAYYLLGRLLENLALQGRVPVLVAGQAANVLFIGLGALALWRVGRAGTSR
jgi:lipopolysaccharide export system permease protein